MVNKQLEPESRIKPNPRVIQDLNVICIEKEGKKAFILGIGLIHIQETSRP